MPNQLGTIIGPASDEGGDSALALAKDGRDRAVVHVFHSIGQGLMILDKYREGTDPEIWDGVRAHLLASDMPRVSERHDVEIVGAPATAISGAIVNTPVIWNGELVLVKRRYPHPVVQQCFLSPLPEFDAAMFVVTDETGSYVVIMRSKTQVREGLERYRHCFPPKLYQAVRNAVPDLRLPDIAAEPVLTVDGSAASVIALAFEFIAALNRQN